MHITDNSLYHQSEKTKVALTLKSTKHSYLHLEYLLARLARFHLNSDHFTMILQVDRLIDLPESATADFLFLKQTNKRVKEGTHEK
jgi:hypothetical protein